MTIRPARSRLSGLRAWWVQRLGAIGMLLFLVFLLLSLALHPLHTYSEWRAWVGRPAITLVWSLFFLALLAHMWVGLRDVLLDYARPAGVQRGLLAAVAVGLVGLGVWMLACLLRLHA
jgi:succinate dehydrogenase / fumarate reductase, membrane anchor subunit